MRRTIPISFPLIVMKNRCINHLVLFCFLVAYPAFTAELTLSFGGDLGLSSSGSPALSSAGSKNGAVYPLETLTAGLRPLWDADLNFANLEVVVTDRNLSPAGKKYVFKTHPTAVKTLIAQGLNLFSTANNHSYDFLEEGARETALNMRDLEGLCHSAGVGQDLEEALSVKLFNVRGYKVAFAAIGILSENNSSHRAGENKAGTASYRKMNSQMRSGPDYDELLLRMKNTKADLKILSIHFGTEKQVSLDPGQREDFHKAITQGDVDVVLGHHAHVVRPWEVISYGGRSRVIFYGLGNYLHLGTAAAEYGLYGKVFLNSNSRGRLEAQALKLVALTDTNLKARPHSPAAHASRMDRLNRLNKDQLGSQSLIVENIEGRSYSRSCWGGNLGPEAKDLCE